MLARYRQIPADMQRSVITGGFIVLQAFIWLILYNLLWYGDKTITDTPVYFEYASHIVKGAFPYRDFSIEYPPIAMLLFLLPRLLSGSSYFMFVFWFEAEMLLCSIGIILLLSYLSWSLWQSAGKLFSTLGLYTLFALSIGSIVEARFDIAMALIILSSLVSFSRGRYFLAWLLLGVGVMTKVVPLIIAPLFLIYHLRRRQMGELWMGPAVMLLTALIIALPFLIASPEGLIRAFIYHAERPLQIESSWASPLLLLSRVSGYEVSIMSSYGSHNVYASISDMLALLSGPATALLLLVGYAVFWKRSLKVSDPGGLKPLLVRFICIAMATFIVGGKVFSPQFLIWLLPLVPLVEGRGRKYIAAMFAGVLLLTQWEFPYRYWELYLMNTGMVVEVALRNALLALLVAALLFLPSSLRREPVLNAS